ncbi:type I-E CRISPR-associated protein Cas5/CasD [Kocuria sp.]|uniref:type I-E CRISPR-associated protein Cas5/CasD n=1 Tax=Kocuria sp. TaxID=1871328 RepID=UPI0026E00386|nr:type I-E CRISPR-associated protein Cas5/CasD [Kocuria sp.]MDO5617957.1 type I-E CRISPR-associated protein Cas5/CasD [Kocuria sp.]
MTVLLLKLKGPQQSWGVTSRFQTREAGTAPSKSGVIGLVASAQGRARDAELTDLVGLEFGVRVDQPGELLNDFHTARRSGDKNSMLSHRHYRQDAAYTAALSGSPQLLAAIAEAVESPKFPLYLGRRSAPAPVDLLGGITEHDDVESALRDLESAPWLAAKWHREQVGQTVYLPLARDARDGEDAESVQDVPVSFDPRHRTYSRRGVTWTEPVVVENPDGKQPVDVYFETVKGA